MINVIDEIKDRQEISKREYEQLSLTSTPGNPFITGFVYDADTATTEDHFELGPETNEIGQNILSRQLRSSEKALQRAPNNAYLLTNLGIGLLNSGKAEEAIEYFRKALWTKEDLVSAKFSLAKAHVRLGNLEEARAIYESLYEVNPKNPVVRINLAEIYLRLAGKSDLNVSLLEKAEEQLRGFDENNAPAQNNLGIVSFLRGNVQKSIAYFRKALKAEPRSPLVHFNMGVSYFKIKNFRKAALHYSASLSLDRRNFTTVKLLTRCYYTLGDYKRGDALLKEYIDEGKADEEYLNLLADSAYYQGKYERCLRCLFEIVRLLDYVDSPLESLAGYYNNIACAYQALRDFDNAEEYFKKGMDASRSKPETYFNFARLCLGQKRIEDAGECIETIQNLFPNNEGLACLLGWYDFELKRYDGALEWFKRAILVDPKDARPYAMSSFILSEVKYNYQGASAIVKEGLSKAPSSLGLKNNLAYNYLMMGDVSRGRQVLDAIKDSDASREFYLHATRGLLLIKENALREAVRFYTSAISLAPDGGTKSLIKQKQGLELARHYIYLRQYGEARKHLSEALNVKSVSDIYLNQIKKLLENLEGGSSG